MMRRIQAIAIILACSLAVAAAAAEPAPLAALQAIQALSNAEAARSLPVAFEATVTFLRERGLDLFVVVQDGNTGIYVKVKKTITNLRPVPGDRILVQGTTRSGLRPNVLARSISLLYHGAVPKPVPATYKEMIETKRDNIFVTIHGVVRSADLVPNAIPLHTFVAHIPILVDGGEVEALVNSGDKDEDALQGLLDAEVEITGVAGGRFDGKYQLTGINLYVSSLANVKILHRAGASPWSLPIMPMDQIFAAHHVQDLTRRVRVQGSVTYYQPGSAIVLQSGDKSLWIMTRTNSALQIGDVADATGFPDLHDGFLTLTGGEVQDSHVQAPIAPRLATWDQLALSTSLFDLVSIEGRVVTEVREVWQDEYVLASDGQLFSAIYRHPPAGSLSPLPPMMQIPLGSTVRVTGICILEDSNPVDSHIPFNILMRSPDDIAVVAGPPLLNVRNLVLLVGLMLAILIVFGARGWILERNVRSQTAELAYIEQRRSRILEDINGSRPLAEIVEHITELASFKLHGAPCWCQIADGAQLGNCPLKLTALRIVHHQIPARSGPPLGDLFAAFDPLTKPSAIEPETLSMAAGLAVLAIETRWLYSDLLHRTEFDLLTDIHNRFSLDKHMDAMIEEARQKAGIFGLIYIDLDEFKQVNDLYGHQIGDIYLQEVALRMKHQLRSHDLLARLGGDEFAVLVALVHNRAGVEEIAVRLERCFDEPYAIEGYLLRGSASVGIALYPQDGATKDSLLNAADATMYAAKNTKRHIGQMLDGHGNPELTSNEST
ncbi:MAG: GGDEF domain-containing protein [Terracidiphilus sp.]